MSRCSPLSEAATATAEVENTEEMTASVELERAFGGNPTASNGERYAASPTAEDDLDEGASDNAKLRHATLGHRPSRSAKLKRWKKKVTS
jgi:hypothetical protein